MKQLSRVHRATESHWVGDGFPVRTMFSYDRHGADISPFLLFDYAGPENFAPASMPRGVGQHPHRGFETVTIVYQGEVEHADTIGNKGVIGPSDVQWMTAAKGILHEEMHSQSFTEKGGTLEMIQLWVNLPASDKMSQPDYQDILNGGIPVVPLGDDGSMARIIAGELNGARGPARTHTPINLWDVCLKTGNKSTLDMPDGHSTMAFVLRGRVLINGAEQVNTGELAMFERTGQSIEFDASEDTTLLIMDGEPINEPIVGQGPFVMNTPAEIKQAYADFRAGNF